MDERPPIAWTCEFVVVWHGAIETPEGKGSLLPPREEQFCFPAWNICSVPPDRAVERRGTWPKSRTPGRYVRHQVYRSQRWARRSV